MSDQKKNPSNVDSNPCETRREPSVPKELDDDQKQRGAGDRCGIPNPIPPLSSQPPVPSRHPVIHPFPEYKL